MRRSMGGFIHMIKTSSIYVCIRTHSIACLIWFPCCRFCSNCSRKDLPVSSEHMSEMCQCNFETTKVSPEAHPQKTNTSQTTVLEVTVTRRGPHESTSAAFPCFGFTLSPSASSLPSPPSPSSWQPLASWRPTSWPRPWRSCSSPPR